MALGARRWFIIRCEMTISAFLNALSMALSSTDLPSGETPVPPGIGPMATLLGNFS